MAVTWTKGEKVVTTPGHIVKVQGATIEEIADELDCEVIRVVSTKGGGRLLVLPSGERVPVGDWVVRLSVPTTLPDGSQGTTYVYERMPDARKGPDWRNT